MAFGDEIDALAARGQYNVSEKARKLVRLTAERRLVRAYRACLCGPDGEFTRDAQLMLADLARLAGLGTVRPFRPTEEVQFDEGQRRIVLHMLALASADPPSLTRLARQLRENEHE